MFNIRHAATAVTTVTVAAAVVTGYVRTRKTENPTVEAVKAFYSPEFLAFNEAQRISSDRMLAGHYDDVSDAQVRAEFDVLYANFLNKN